MPYQHAQDCKAAENIINLLAELSSFSWHLSRMPKTSYLGSFSCMPLLVASVLLEDRSEGGMTLWPVTLNSATCLEPGESKPKSVVLGAPPSNVV